MMNSLFSLLAKQIIYYSLYLIKSIYIFAFFAKNREKRQACRKKYFVRLAKIPVRTHTLTAARAAQREKSANAAFVGDNRTFFYEILRLF